MKHRLEFLSDGVFAIAMTLLALELKVPEVPHGATGPEVWQALGHSLPVFFAYLMAFLLSSMYWLVHYRLFRPLKTELDMVFFVLNTILLLAVSLVPVTLSVFEKWGMRAESLQLFLVNYSFIAFVLGCLSLYAWRRGFWTADHAKTQAIRIAFTTPAVGVGGLAGAAFLSGESPLLMTVPILVGVILARLLYRNYVRRQEQQESSPPPKAAAGGD